MNTTIYVLSDTQVPMELRTKYTLQKLPDFDLYILVRQSDTDSYGHWSGLETKESMDTILQDNFMPYRMSKKQILDYVQVEIMKQGGRAVAESRCVLETSDGKCCGFSLCLTDEARNNMVKVKHVGFVKCMLDTFVEDSLREEFKGHEYGFWIHVQSLHDQKENWDANNTLSEKGVKRYNEILAEYED
jgi:hypothetical protein